MATLPATGVIDADGHVLEPADLWEVHLDTEFRDRGIHVRVDAQGLEYLEVDGRPLSFLQPGSLAMLGAMGDDTARSGPDRRYMEVMPAGACDPAARIGWLDAQGLDAAVLYPTLGIIWEAAIDDARLTDAYARAYNRWLAEFCRDGDGRLVGVAHLSLANVDLAVAELERAVADGLRGAFVVPYTWTRLPHGHPQHDPLWAAAEALGVPVGIHPAYEPAWANTLGRFTGTSSNPGQFDVGGQLMSNLVARQGVQQAFSSFFTYGTLERFPRLQLGVLESGAGWIGSLLDRMDALMHETMFKYGQAMRERPSEVFARQCWISCDPEETAAPHIIDHVGADRFVWATDYPHPDHPADWRTGLARFMAPLSDETAAKVAGDNARRLYGLG